MTDEVDREAEAAWKREDPRHLQHVGEMHRLYLFGYRARAAEQAKPEYPPLGDAIKQFQSEAPNAFADLDESLEAMGRSKPETVAMTHFAGVALPPANAAACNQATLGAVWVGESRTPPELLAGALAQPPHTCAIGNNCAGCKAMMARWARVEPLPWDEGGRYAYFSKLPGDARLVAGLDPVAKPEPLQPSDDAELIAIVREAIRVPENGALVCRWCGAGIHETHDATCHYVQMRDGVDRARLTLYELERRLAVRRG